MPENPAGGSIRPGQSPTRVGIFTDAVLAIAMTLLVIEIPRPEEADFKVGPHVSKTQAFDNLWHFLVSQHEAFYAYVLAFLIIWIVWREHHEIIDQVNRVSTSMLAWHFPLLLLAAFLPYASTVMGHYSDNPLAALLFGLVVGALLFCRSEIESRAGQDHVLRPHINLGEYHADTVVSWIVTGYWFLSLVLVWWTPWVQIPWILTSAVGYLASRIVRRSPAPQAPQAPA